MEQEPAQTHRKKIAGRTILALWLILGPTVLIIFSFLIYAISNYITGSLPSDSQNEMFATSSVPQTFLNIFLFGALGLGMLAWLPGLIAGIVLLTTRPKQNTPTTLQ